MIALLALPLSLASAAAVQEKTAPPAIHLDLSEDVYSRGDKAKVKVRMEDDGYLLVLRADADGRIRVLFPLDPEDTAMVRGGKQFEIRGRGDRQAFQVYDREGAGVVLAARSDEPFDFEGFSRGAHWDYKALASDRVGSDPEGALLDIVDRMSSEKYEYDARGYAVVTHQFPSYSAYWYDPLYYGAYRPGWVYGPRFGFRLSSGWGRWHGWGGWN